MQSLVLPPSSFITSEFGHPRFDPSPERLSLNLSRSTNARRCSPRDLPLPRSMSGSVPAEDPLETSGHHHHYHNHSRPSRHSELLPPATTVASSTAASTSATALPAALTGSVVAPGSPHHPHHHHHPTPPAPAHPPLVPLTTTVHEPVLHRVASAAPGDELPRQAFPLGDAFAASRLPPSLAGQGTPQPSAPTYSQTTFATSPPGGATRALPQKPTRRTKAHVASACVNCKKKHLGCDPARPCRRCVLSGKEATCVDVTHKKRGRPPLKAEETSLRYAAQADNAATAGGQHGSQPRRTHMHRATSSREIRPMTDLQMPGGPPGPPAPGAAMGMRATGQPHRWPVSMYPPNLDPSLTMQRNIGHRRFSSSGSVQSMTAVSPPGFVPMAGGYNPALGGAGRMHVGVARPLSSYGQAALHPAASPPQYHHQHPFGVPISPYAENHSRMAPNRLSIGEPPLPPRDPRESYLESPVRLPPIYPPPPPTMTHASPGPPHSHRLSDPYPAVWSPRARDEVIEQRQHLPPHSYLDQLSSSPSQMRQGGAHEFSYEAAIPRQMAGVPTTTTQRHSIQIPPTRTRDDDLDAEPSDARPTKRRKMALDDMVND